MQTLSVLAVEDGAIIVASPAGERFRLPVDAALRARITSPTVQSDEKRLSPREIQAHVRSGLTADQVAAMTGVPVAFIERFVGPVLAERAYIVESALAVRLPPETEGARARTFGAVMGERLDALAAKEVRWTSAKEPSGWILAVAFTADDVQHAARWRFDPKHMRLDADNVEASTLSQQGIPAALTPRLRAIEPTAPVTIVPQARTEPSPSLSPLGAAAPASSRPPQLHGTRVAPVPPTEPDRTRFDSAVFRFPPIEPGPKQDQEARRNLAAPAQRPTGRSAGSQAGAERPTSEQLDQLQRRRGERGPAPEPVTDTASLPVTRAMDVVDTGDVFAPRPVATRQEPSPQPPHREPASVHQLPVRTPQAAPTQNRAPQGTPVRPPQAPPVSTRTAQPTSPIPPAFARPAAGSAFSRPTPAPPRQPQERPADPMRRRRDRGRPGSGPSDPIEPTTAPGLQDGDDDGQDLEAPVPAARPRRGRTSMPSWDEIVFGRDEP